jgi:Kef-type K+ transport system membrane component KefB
MGAIAPAVAVAVAVTLAFNVIGGVVAARIYGYGADAAANTALMLVSRGEFELILASLAVAAGLDGRVAPFAALYVLVLSILSPLFSARSFVLARRLPGRWFAPQPDRATAADPDDRAWLQTVVCALAIDIFDAAPVRPPGRTGTR